MRALVYEAPGKAAFKNVSKPTIGTDEVLIKTKFASICGTDLHILDGKFPARRGVVLGHEASGIVEAVGNAVQNVKPGEKVICAPYLVCGQCTPCRAGRYNVCTNRKHLGIEVDGVFAEYFKLPSYAVYPLPQGMSLEEGALLEPASVGYHAVRRVAPTPSDFVVIIGAGPIGLFILQSAAAFNCQKIIVSELIKQRLELAKCLGADRIVNPEKEDLRRIVMEETAGEGADIVIEAVGSSETIAESVYLVRPAGKICIVGIPTERVAFDFLTLVRKEIDIITSDASLLSYEKTQVLVSKKIIDVQRLITHRFEFDDIYEALNLMRRREIIKALIVFG